MDKNKGLPLKRLFSYLKPYYKSVILIAVLSIIGNLFYVAAPLLIGRAVDNIIEAGKVNFDNLIKILIVLGGLYIINALCVWLYTSLGVSIAVKTTNDIRRQAFQKLVSLPLKVIDNMEKGDLLSRFTADCDQITDAITQTLNQFFSGIVIIFAALGFMLFLSPIVTLAVVVTVPLMFLVSRLVAKKSSQKLLKMQKVMGTLSSYAEEHIRGARVVKAFNFEQEAQKQFDVINQELNKIGIKAQFIAALSNPSTRLLNYFSYALVGLIGGLSAIYLNFSIGALTSFLTYAVLFSRPFNEFTSVTSQIISGLAGASRMFEIVDITLIRTGENQNKNIIAKGEFDFVDNKEVLGNLKHPTSILTFSKSHPSVAKHRTEKPVALLEYLIKTYSNEGNLVLDSAMGSGSTGVACRNTSRDFIGIELDENCFKIAKERIGEEVDKNE